MSIVYLVTTVPVALMANGFRSREESGAIRAR